MNYLDSWECGHIVSVRDGGNDSVGNLRPVCSTCNKNMGTENMDSFIEKYTKACPKIKPVQAVQPVKPVKPLVLSAIKFNDLLNKHSFLPVIFDIIIKHNNALHNRINFKNTLELVNYYDFDVFKYVSINQNGIEPLVLTNKKLYKGLLAFVDHVINNTVPLCPNYRRPWRGPDSTYEDYVTKRFGKYHCAYKMAMLDSIKKIKKVIARAYSTSIPFYGSLDILTHTSKPDFAAFVDCMLFDSTNLVWETVRNLV